MAGAIAVVSGLYAVLWGKAKDPETRGDMSPGDDSIGDESLLSGKIDLKEPLLGEKLPDVEEGHSQTNL